jgi:hypothetical protein
VRELRRDEQMDELGVNVQLVGMHLAARPSD